jgi:nucleotide-binding universal stress UspA family protein
VQAVVWGTVMRVFEPGGAHQVVVGVDGSPESVEAARFAAHEAAIRGLELLVVHACVTGSGRSRRGVAVADGRPATGQALVDEALSHVRVAPKTKVRTVVEAASAGALLRAVSDDAALLVLGQHQFDLATGRLTGQVARAVGASARCPVVVVPAGWTRTVAGSAHLGPRPIVVAVGGRSSGTAVLQVAFEEAELRQASVLILHASTRADLGTSQGAASARNLAEIVAGQHQDHPDVSIDYRVVPAPSVLAWVDASSRASLMVLGRPQSPCGYRSWQHSVARAMLHQARCPLVVVPARTRSASAAGRPLRGTPSVLVS